MHEVFRYRSRVLRSEDLVELRRLIAQHSQASRAGLSRLVCEAWGWRQTNGALCDMLCRSLMLALHRAGHIALPAPRHAPRHHPAQRRKPATDFLLDQSPIAGALADLPPLTVRQVRRTGEEALFNGLIERYHYLGYTQPVGEHLKYLLLIDERPIAGLGWSSAPWHIGPRDRFIGWTPAVRRRHLHLIAYNTRFLILPWVRVRHLASHILSVVIRRISRDWQQFYAHPLYYLETFVDRERFRGTCYRAANWLYLGQTTGRGKKDKKHQITLSLKDVLGYPLTEDFRVQLGVSVAP
jgi:hypothetical protein